MESEKRSQPPFDGSAPCPACPTDVRATLAIMHNAMNRAIRGTWPVDQVSEMLHMKYVLTTHSDNEDIEAGLNKAREVYALVQTVDPVTNRFTAEVTKQIMERFVEYEQLEYKISPICEAHFDDSRHATGEWNLLREKQGSHDKYSALAQANDGDGSYHYKVTPTTDLRRADMVHLACKSGYMLDQFFKDKLITDNDFYGMAWCPRCRINAPVAQFEFPFLTERNHVWESSDEDTLYTTAQVMQRARRQISDGHTEAFLLAPMIGLRSLKQFIPTNEEERVFLGLAVSMFNMAVRINSGNSNLRSEQQLLMSWLPTFEQCASLADHYIETQGKRRD